jgi:hypothetical protein
MVAFIDVPPGGLRRSPCRLERPGDEADDLLGTGRPGLAHRGTTALPQHRDPVRDREHVLDVVRDQDDRLALRPQPVDESQHLAHLGHRQRRRRLVHDDQLGVDVERPRDRHALPLPAGERLDPDIEVRHVDIELAQELAGPAPHRTPVEEGHARHLANQLAAEEDVVGDRHLPRQRQLLVDRRNPPGPGVLGPGEFHHPPVEPHLAGVRPVRAGHHLDQRGFACAVVADQRHHLAAAELEVDALERQHAAEPLGDARHRKLGHVEPHALTTLLAVVGDLIEGFQ